MSRGNIKRWIMMCLLFSGITLIWFSDKVRRGNYWTTKVRGKYPAVHNETIQEISRKIAVVGLTSDYSNDNTTSTEIVKTSTSTNDQERTQSQSTLSQKSTIFPIAPQCSLSWNTIGLNVDSYETENNTVQRSTSGRTSVTVKPIFEDPTITLNPEKFLLPVVTWGPNNQLIGLWEGAFVAITLNRTLVLPRFRKHNTDRQWKRGMANRISPIHRIDAAGLCKYISCVTLDDFQKACNFEVDAILNIRYLKMKQVRDIESNIRMKLLPEGAVDTSSLSDMLVPPNGTSLQKPFLRFNEDEIKLLFDNTEKCVIEPFPFFDLLAQDKTAALYNRVTKGAFTDSNTRSDVMLLANIMKNSQQPQYIRDIAKDFLSKILDGGPHVSVHWRYNEGDYLADWHCNAKEANAKRCAKVRNYTAQDFANRLEQEVTKLKKRSVSIKHIYIASPRSGSSMLSRLSEEVQGKEWKVFSSVDLEKFVKDHYSNCDFILKHSEDILSSTEMEICARGVTFLGSLSSSWTGNVRRARIFQDDDNIDTSPDFVFRA